MATVRYTSVNGEVIAEKRGGVRRFYVPDPLGSTVALLDTSQAQTDTFAYWPYGEEQARNGRHWLAHWRRLLNRKGNLMKEEIEQALQPLVGEPLSDMWRYFGLQKFEFGIQRPHKNRYGEEITKADWGLVVACDWRISGAEGEIVSSDDFGPDDTRRDEKAYPFYEMVHEKPPIVASLEAEEEGRVCFFLEGGYILELVPDTDPAEEKWRLMHKDGPQSDCVFATDGDEQ